MPPPGASLPDGDIATLKKWIDGRTLAQRRGTCTGLDRRPQDHRCRPEILGFSPGSGHRPARGKGSGVGKKPDRSFHACEAGRKTYSAGEPVDKGTLLRRATYDLTGLPPTPKELQTFLRTNTPAAFAKVVDRLLASPHYGERWGRHWLDVARYADSTGMDEDHVYPDAWRYRDYVVKAFNDDLPYNRFVMEQLAGDLMPHVRCRRTSAWNHCHRFSRARP